MKKAMLFEMFLAMVGFGAALMVYPAHAQARDSGWDRSQHHHWYRHGPCASLPRNYLSINVGGNGFYYSDGSYYRPCPGGYVIVPAPVGACVPTIPSYQTVVVGGASYYNYDGTYYQQAPNGYTVVPTALTKSIPVKAAPVQEVETSAVVNVPNHNGSYTPVTLQLAANGMYIGPQGEVYPTKPDLKQLTVMYGK